MDVEYEFGWRRGERRAINTKSGQVNCSLFVDSGDYASLFEAVDQSVDGVFAL